ncbi:MAG: hypothetical protein LBF61_11715 [Azoarcus sp.]|jgi:hypothetical protein|nr:hypothetical protein [Azoarcus sp.]
MKLPQHPAADYTRILRALLPPGRAWDWADGGLGHALLHGTARELARLDGGLAGILDIAVETHQPRFSSWHISEYQRVADDALAAAGVAESLPRKTFAVGSRAGERLWSAAAPQTDFPVPLVQILHRVGPLTTGRHPGDGSGRDAAARCWSAWRSRYVMVVRYYRSVVDPAVVRAALENFKQSHVFLWFEDISGTGGHHA